jgi:DNA-binding NarL/FixJ family response regulator
MLEDREATLWVGTAKEGLYRADPQAIAMVQHPNGSQWNVVEPALQDRAGSIWFGGRLGLFRLHNGKYENFYHMDLDGIAAYRQITSTDPSARIVLVSDYDDAAMRECARHAGACGYVLKDNLLEVKGLLRTFSAREPQRGRPMENL